MKKLPIKLISLAVSIVLSTDTMAELKPSYKPTFGSKINTLKAKNLQIVRRSYVYAIASGKDILTRKNNSRAM
jgi:hypothetical protein